MNKILILTVLLLAGCQLGQKPIEDCTPTSSQIEQIASEQIQFTEVDVKCVGKLPTADSRNASIYLDKRSGDDYRQKANGKWISKDSFNEVNCF